MVLKKKEYNLKVKYWSPKPTLRVQVPFLLNKNNLNGYIKSSFKI